MLYIMSSKCAKLFVFPNLYLCETFSECISHYLTTILMWCSGILTDIFGSQYIICKLQIILVDNKH